MNIKINPQGNGACPLCNFNKKCNYHKMIHDAFHDTAASKKMEMVIYECPKFIFKDN